MEIKNNNLSFGSKVSIPLDNYRKFEMLSSEGARNITSALKKLEKNGIDDSVTFNVKGLSWDTEYIMTVAEKRGKKLFVGEKTEYLHCDDISKMYEEARKNMEPVNIKAGIIKYLV